MFDSQSPVHFANVITLWERNLNLNVLFNKRGSQKGDSGLQRCSTGWKCSYTKEYRNDWIHNSKIFGIWYTTTLRNRIGQQGLVWATDQTLLHTLTLQIFFFCFIFTFIMLFSLCFCVSCEMSNFIWDQCSFLIQISKQNAWWQAIKQRSMEKRVKSWLRVARDQFFMSDTDTDNTILNVC